MDGRRVIGNPSRSISRNDSPSLTRGFCPVDDPALGEQVFERVLHLSNLSKPDSLRFQVPNERRDLFRAGEPVDHVAEEFGLARDEVEDAIRVVARPVSP